MTFIADPPTLRVMMNGFDVMVRTTIDVKRTVNNIMLKTGIMTNTGISNIINCGRERTRIKPWPWWPMGRPSKIPRWSTTYQKLHCNDIIIKKGRYMVNIRCICMKHVTIITSANEVCLQICSKIYVKVAHHQSTIHLNDPDSGSGT